MSASRFAVLSIEDDEEVKPVTKSGGSAAIQTSKKQGNKKTAKKQKAEQERAELVKLAFAFPKSTKPKTASKANDASLKTSSVNEVEQPIDSSFDQELAEVLKLSKLEYEENLQQYEQQRREASEPPKTKKKSKKASSATIPMDQFNKPQARTSTQSEVNGITSDSSKETTIPVRIPVDESPRVAQLQEELTQKDEEISLLRIENEKLKDDIVAVKTRNKKLYGILGQGEMREKAELLVEVEKLTKIKDELTAEVENLAAQLQQEKSKVSMLTEGKKASGNKK